MNNKYLEGIDKAKEENRKRKNVGSALNSLKDAISELERLTGEDMTTECIMSLLDKK